MDVEVAAEPENRLTTAARRHGGLASS